MVDDFKLKVLLIEVNGKVVAVVSSCQMIQIGFMDKFISIAGTNKYPNQWSSKMRGKYNKTYR